MAGDVHSFEQPLNERIRAFLRLEFLFDRLNYHRADFSDWGRRATLDVLIDLLSVLARFDITGEVSKALGQRFSQLEALRNTSGVDSATIDNLLTRIDSLGRRMQSVPANFAGYLLRDHELLYNLSNRSPIAGGSCGFDLPAYQYWLAQSNERIEADLDTWCGQFGLFEESITLLLRLLREGTDTTVETATNGVCIYNTPDAAQMIRVLLGDPSVFPQISAGRHRATIRFMCHVEGSTRVRQSEQTFDFRLGCCKTR